MKTNKEKMIKLCESMIKLYSQSNYVFADINKLIWEKKLENWKAI
jgi:hypothetical protein